MSETVTAGPPAGGGGWRRLRWVAVGVAAGLLAGGATVWAVGDDVGSGMRRAHFMHRFHRGPMDPEEARQHLQMAVRWVTGFVDATPDQRQKVQTIAEGALDDLLPLRERHHANRAAIHEALSGASVDRQALEQARRDELKLADEASARLIKAVADAAEVLTPEQRAQLAEAAERFHR